ncbi:MAG TPA: 23S rRNA (guanosine(2251)-2'-O)-methyltransferase RlmB [Bacteroidota bacterium]|nr:23S rRNA (guanosine(2251)-2'-O)-methyltransferase RlmB [Bacteroidota bacterium]
MHGIIVGRKPVMEALRAGTHIERVVFLLGVQGRVIEDIRRAAQESNVPVVQATRQQFRELATDATTQGVVAIVPAVRSFAGVEEILASAEAKGEKGLILILDEIEDPQNLGALIRSAECCAVHGVVFPKHHAASVTSTVIKASAGATEHMMMAEVTNIVNTIDQVKKAGYWTVGLASDGGKTFSEIDYTTPSAIVVGNEGKGIRRLVREHCDYLVHIPMYGRLDSFNASVAGALVMYEAARQRHKNP